VSTPGQHSHADDVQRAAGIADPAARAIKAGELQEQFAREIKALAEIRRNAVIQMREGGMTYRKIADAIGVSTPRASQLAGSGWTHTAAAGRNA
jgi:DNA-directed RNA polymerase specialized sigma24 family protein